MIFIDNVNYNIGTTELESVKKMCKILGEKPIIASQHYSSSKQLMETLVSTEVTGYYTSNIPVSGDIAVMFETVASFVGLVPYDFLKLATLTIPKMPNPEEVLTNEENSKDIGVSDKFGTTNLS